MLTKTLKWTTIGTLLAAFVYSSSASHSVWSVTAGGYLELFEIVVWLTAILVVAQAIRAGSYYYFWGLDLLRLPCSSILSRLCRLLGIHFFGWTRFVS